MLDSNLAATLQGSPIRLNANLSVAPKFPAIQIPLLTPIPIATSGIFSSANLIFNWSIFFLFLLLLVKQDCDDHPVE